jgi:uncharacterized protein (TIGR00251 family)
MIHVTEHPEGSILVVRAQPGARRNGIVGEVGGAVKIAVSASPDKGKANQAISEVLRDVLGVKTSQVELLSGFTSRQKRFLIRGWSKPNLEARLSSLLQSGQT